MQKKYELVKDIKIRTDLLLLQLSEGTYTSLDAYINNLTHIRLAYCEYNPFTTDPEFLAWLQRKDATFLPEIALTGRLIMALQNFFRLAINATQ